MNKKEAEKIIKEYISKPEDVNNWEVYFEYFYDKTITSITLDMRAKNYLSAINEANVFIRDIHTDKKIKVVSSTIFKNKQKQLILNDPIFCIWSNVA